MTPPLIYLASPYTYKGDDNTVREDVEHGRFLDACRCAAMMTRRGLYVFSPIVHSHPMATRYVLPTDFAFWCAHNRRWIDACDELAVLTINGWRESTGIAGELEYALSRGKRVWHVDLDGNEVEEAA